METHTRLLRKVVDRYVRFSEADWRYFESCFVYRELPKNYLLVAEGQVAREMYFVLGGLLRLFYNKDGDHRTTFIFREGLFAGSYDSFLQQKPGIQLLESLEPCQLLAIKREDWVEIHTRIPLMNVLTRMIAEERFLNAQRILASFQLDSPEERYRKFLEEEADLLLRVPHHIIASYLGITPVSLSRIRKRIQ